jgi:histidinol dehydrogenase
MRIRTLLTKRSELAAIRYGLHARRLGPECGALVAMFLRCRDVADAAVVNILADSIADTYRRQSAVRPRTSSGLTASRTRTWHFREASANIRPFHERQKQQSWITTPAPGTTLGQLVLPVSRAGLYVPGGQGGETPLISSLLMNAIPALVAGVGSICVVSPPRRDGPLHPYILATAAILGIAKCLPVARPGPIAALACYGHDGFTRGCHCGPGKFS